MAFEKPLIEIIENRDEESLRRLVIPYDGERFAEISELCEMGTYMNFCQFPSRKDTLSAKQSALGNVVFDQEGGFYMHFPDDFEQRLQSSNGSIDIVIGNMPKSIVWTNMKGHPIPNKGGEIVLPKQYVYILMFREGMFAAITPNVSGRMPVSEGMPVMFYTKPTRKGEDAIGILVPYKHTVEIPEMFTVYPS